MAVTYEPIATHTLPSNSFDYTFTSIPSTYTDLELVINFGQSTADDMLIRVGNGSIDTGSNYSSTTMQGNGSTATSFRYSSNSGIQPRVAANPPTSIGAVWRERFMNYSNTTTYKTTLGRLDYANGETEAHVGLWRSTSAINQIRIQCFTYNFLAGSTFTLYGIKAA